MQTDGAQIEHLSFVKIMICIYLISYLYLSFAYPFSISKVNLVIISKPRERGKNDRQKLFIYS